LKNDISYEADHDVNINIHRYQEICETNNIQLKRQVRKEKNLKCYKVMAS